ncbi:MAG: type II secretion system minor pseudopilin GspI [Gammaproteobacteria bacterium]|nr:type II secretion system minor pseudopilin GspI [Gammaproteobacteria bacterium]
MKISMEYFRYKQKAFTLLEVLVALAVLTMGLGTVIKVAGTQASQLSYLKDKTVALWIANNKASEVQLDNWPETGTSSGQEIMANQEWRWELTVSNTADKDLRRLDIHVNRVNEKGEPIVRFIAFTGKRSSNTATP